MSKVNTRAIIFILIAFFCSSYTESFADTYKAKGEYEATYQRLLGKRKILLDDRARSIRNLTQVDSWLNQVNKGMQVYTPEINREQLLATRTYLLNFRDKVQRDLDFQDMTLRNLEKDLSWIETEMKQIACMNQALY